MKASDKDADNNISERKVDSLMHTLKVEVKGDSAFVNKIFEISDLARKCGNQLISVLNNRLKQVHQTKKYRKLCDLIDKNKKNKELVKKYKEQLEDLYKQHGLTKSGCEAAMKNIRHRINKGRKYQLGYIFAQSKADYIYIYGPA